MNQFTGDSPTAVEPEASTNTADSRWANRRNLRANLYASERLLATLLYLMFVVLAGTTLLI